MKKIIATVTLFLLFFISSSITQAQTTYKSDPGFFTPLLKTLYLKGGSFESAQLIGPAAGYRFNKNYDIALHTEFLFSEHGNQAAVQTSLLNLGITLGHTRHFSERLMLRSDISLYKFFNFKVENYPDRPDPSLNSALGSSSLYATLPITDAIRILPNLGGFLGYGDYTPALTSANPTQSFDGFVAGPQIGLDAVFELSDDIYFTARPAYRIWYYTDYDVSDGEFMIDFQLNF